MDALDRARAYSTGKVDQIQMAASRKDSAEVARILRQIATDGHPAAIGAILRTLAEHLSPEELAVIIATGDTEEGE